MLMSREKYFSSGAAEKLRQQIGKSLQVEVAKSYWGLDVDGGDHRWNETEVIYGRLEYADERKLRLNTPTGVKEIYRGEEQNINLHVRLGLALSPCEVEHLVTRIITTGGENFLKG